MNKLELAFDFIAKKVRKFLGADECARCHAKNQQLHNGLCPKCEIIIKLAGWQEELKNLKTRPHGGLNHDQAQRHFMRITELESEIPKLMGQLSAFDQEVNKDHYALMVIKKILIAILVLSILIGYLGIYAWGDYTWANSIIVGKQAEGWDVAATSGNYIDITHPWTIFKQPVVQIAFVKPDEILPIEENYIFFTTLWVNNRNFETTSGELFNSVVDCKDNRDAYVDEKITITDINLSKLKWRASVIDSPGDEVNKFVCNELKKQEATQAKQQIFLKQKQPEQKTSQEINIELLKLHLSQIKIRAQALGNLGSKIDNGLIALITSDNKFIDCPLLSSDIEDYKKEYVSLKAESLALSNEASIIFEIEDHLYLGSVQARYKRDFDYRYKQVCL